jgi:hypothetical protein
MGLSKTWALLFEKRPVLLILIKFLIIFALFFFLLLPSIDPDFGWHLTAGNYVLAHGLPRHDLYTYTARNFAWINHEWGSDVLLSIMYGLGGYVLLAAFYAVLWSLALLINNFKARFIILISATLALFSYAGVRQVAWSVFLFAVLLKIINSPKARKYIWFIPLLFLVWANLHGGFVVGFIALAFQSVKERRAFWLYILGLSVIATFINPYGPRLYEEIFRTLTDRTLHSQILEWHSFTFYQSSIVFMGIWGAVFLLDLPKKIKDLWRLDLLMLAASFSATRNMPFFIISALTQLNKPLDKLLKQIPNPKKLDWTRFAVLVFIAAFILGFIGFGLWQELASTTKGSISLPKKAVAYLNSHPCQGNLFNDYNLGGYLIWQAPNTPVYIDGRMPSWRDQKGHKYMDRYFNILKDEKAQGREFKQYNISCVLLINARDEHPMIVRLQKAGWNTKLVDHGSYLLIKN